MSCPIELPLQTDDGCKACPKNTTYDSVANECKKCDGTVQATVQGNVCTKCGPGERYTPPDEKCGTYETKGNQRYIATPTMTTMAACKADCDKDKGCHGYSWKANTPLFEEKFKGRCAGTGDGLNEHLAIPFRYVRIRASDWMNFSQVTVRDKAGNNLSKKKPCTSDGAYGNRGNNKCWVALDGNEKVRKYTSGKPSSTHGNFVSKTSNRSYWQVDLGNDAKKMASVTIHNRGDDCCKDRLGNATMELLDEEKNVIGTKRLTKANEQTHHLFDFDIKTIPKELSHDDKLETCNSQCKKVEGAKGFIMYQGHENPTPTKCSKITDRDECLASKDSSGRCRFAKPRVVRVSTPGGKSSYYAFKSKEQAEERCRQDGLRLCSKAEIEKQSICAWGWTSDAGMGFPMQYKTRGCGSKGWNSKKGGKAAAHCCGIQPTFSNGKVCASKAYIDSKTKARKVRIKSSAANLTFSQVSVVDKDGRNLAAQYLKVDPATKPTHILGTNFKHLKGETEYSCRSACWGKGYKYSSFATNSAGCRCSNGLHKAHAYKYGTGIFERVDRKVSCTSNGGPRYVRIIADEWMNFSQVTVKDADGNNISEGKKCTSDGLYANKSWFGCDVALDGNQKVRSHKDRHRRIYHSKTHNKSYWQVDLGDDDGKKMASVTIHNRGDCCKGRLGRATLQVLNENGEVIGSKRLVGNVNEQTHNLYEIFPNGCHMALDGFGDKARFINWFAPDDMGKGYCKPFPNDWHCRNNRKRSKHVMCTKNVRSEQQCKEKCDANSLCRGYSYDARRDWCLECDETNSYYIRNKTNSSWTSKPNLKNVGNYHNSFTFAFNNECDGPEHLKYEGGNKKPKNPGSYQQKSDNCYKKCIKAGTYGGFIVRSDGRCWCEKDPSKNCKRYGGKTYNRFDMPAKNKTWEVDLGGDVDVNAVKIVNTASTDYRSLRSATVEVLDKNNKVMATKALRDIISSEVDMVYIPMDISPKDRNAEHLDTTDPSKKPVTSHGACFCSTQDASTCSKTDTTFAKFGPRRYDFLASLPEGTTGECVRAKKGDALENTFSTAWVTQERKVCGSGCAKASVRLSAVYDEKNQAYTDVCPPGTTLKNKKCKANPALSDMTKEECREAHGVIRKTVKNSSLPPMACSVVTHEKMIDEKGYCNDKTLRRGAYMKGRTLEQCAETCKNQDYDNFIHKANACHCGYTAEKRQCKNWRSNTQYQSYRFACTNTLREVEDNSLPKGCVYDTTEGRKELVWNTPYGRTEKSEHFSGAGGKGHRVVRDWGNLGRITILPSFETVRKGECHDTEVLMFEGQHKEPKNKGHTNDDMLYNCAKACDPDKNKDKIFNVRGKKVEGRSFKGFIVYPELGSNPNAKGRCFCETGDSKTCRVANNPYVRFDYTYDDFCCKDGPNGKAYTFSKASAKDTANFQKADYAPWGEVEAERFCMSWGKNRGKDPADVFSKGACTSA